MGESMIAVEVVYGTDAVQKLVKLQVTSTCTVDGAIRQSKITEQFPEIDLTSTKVGVWGDVCRMTDLLKPGDRVEIYRPLQIDPKDARRRRSQTQPRKSRT